MHQPLRFERKGPITTLTLDLPEQRNALTGEALFAAFEDAVAMINRDAETCAVVLTATGKVFSAGGNVQEMRERSGMFGGRPDQVMENYHRGIQRIPLALDALEVPSIAAVNGPAIGAGCDLALFCDIRIASTTAVFAESFAKLGIISGDGGAWVLPRLVGWQQAAIMTFTGEGLDAEAALAAGLVAKVVPAEDLMAEATALAEKIAANPAQVVRWNKQLMKAARTANLKEFLGMAGAVQAVAHHAPGHAQAIEAFFAARERR